MPYGCPASSAPRPPGILLEGCVLCGRARRRDGAAAVHMSLHQLRRALSPAAQGGGGLQISTSTLAAAHKLPRVAKSWSSAALERVSRHCSAQVAGSGEAMLLGARRVWLPAVARTVRSGRIAAAGVAAKHSGRRRQRRPDVVSVAIVEPGRKQVLTKLLEELDLPWWDGGSLSASMTAARKQALDDQLLRLGIDAADFAKFDTANLALRSAGGNGDGLSGASAAPRSGGGVPDYMPAVRAYQHFIWPRDKHVSHAISDSVSEERVQAAAGRCARQVSMLMRRAQVQADEDFRNLDADRVVAAAAGAATANAGSSRPAATHGGQQQQPSPQLQRATGLAEEAAASAAAAAAFPGVALVLDNVRSAFNTGNILRTAECSGVSMVLLCGITPRPDSAAVAKAAVGAETKLADVGYAENSADAVRSLKAKGYTIVAVETHERAVPYTTLDFAALARRDHLATRDGGSTPESGTVIRAATATTVAARTSANSRASKGDGITSIATAPGGGVALVVGNEVYGVSHEILECSDHIVEVPCLGLKNSLNVSALVPVVLYEMVRQLHHNHQQEDDERGHL